MTLASYAKEKHISRQTIYNKLSAAGIELDAIRDSATGQLTPDGIRQLDALKLGAKTVDAKTVDTKTVKDTIIADRLAELQTALDAMTERAKRAEEDAAEYKSLWISERELTLKLTDRIPALPAAAPAKAAPEEAPRTITTDELKRIPFWQRVTGKVK